MTEATKLARAEARQRKARMRIVERMVNRDWSFGSFGSSLMCTLVDQLWMVLSEKNENSLILWKQEMVAIVEEAAGEEWR